LFRSAYEELGGVTEELEVGDGGIDGFTEGFVAGIGADLGLGTTGIAHGKKRSRSYIPGTNFSIAGDTGYIVVSGPPRVFSGGIYSGIVTTQGNGRDRTLVFINLLGDQGRIFSIGGGRVKTVKTG
jgi:hypothetical protein